MASASQAQGPQALKPRLPEEEEVVDVSPSPSGFSYFPSLHEAASALTVRSARTGRSQGSWNTELHGVVTSQTSHANSQEVQLVISQIDDFEQVAKEPPCRTPDRVDPTQSQGSHMENPTLSVRDMDLERNKLPDTAVSLSIPSAPPKSAKPKPACMWASCWWRPCWRKCGLVTSMILWTVLVVCGACVGLFWPQDPSWRLTRLQMDMDAMMALVRVASEGAGAVVDTVPAQRFRCEVEVKNTNLLGAASQPGNILFVFDGREVGAGVVEAARLPAQSAASVLAEGTLQVDQNLLSAFAEELTSPKPTLAFEILATADIKTFFGVLHYRMHCAVDFSISDLMMAETRSRAVTSRDCQHSYF